MVSIMVSPRNANVFLSLGFSNLLHFVGLIAMLLYTRLRISWRQGYPISTMHLKRFGRIGWQSAIRLQGSGQSGMRIREGISVLIPIPVHYGQERLIIICSSMVREG